MKKKNINKAILFTSLLIMNTTANGFHQCVPKKRLIQEIVREAVEWKFIGEKEVEIKLGFSLFLFRNLSIGDYKIKLLKDNKVIAENFFTINEQSDINSSNAIFKCEDVLLDKYKELNFNDAKFIKDNAVFNKDLNIYKHRCDGEEKIGEVGYVVLISGETKVLFAVRNMRGEYNPWKMNALTPYIPPIFDELNGATLEIYKKK